MLQEIAIGNQIHAFLISDCYYLDNRILDHVSTFIWRTLLISDMNIIFN